jgi:hypothetical protein
MNHIVALSGGKDSTAMALRLAEVEPRAYTYLCTPTGDELPEMQVHWDRLERMLGAPVIRLTNGTLASWIGFHGALPNWRMRWCTRQLKIEPTLAYLATHQPCTHYVGLRADEPLREGLYGARATVTRFPLREWGWGLREVRAHLRQRGVAIPRRTDCARCYGQRVSEWRDLWAQHPDIYADAEAQEVRVGATFRSPGRDRWPASLRLLRDRFEREPIQTELFDADDGAVEPCRVCRL